MEQFSSLLSWRLIQLNMFRAFSRPSSGAQWLQWKPLVLPSSRGDSRVVFVVGPDGRLARPRALHVSDRFSIHHQDSSTAHTAIHICHTGCVDCLLAGSGCSILMGCSILIPPASSQHNLCYKYLLLCVQKTCPKHVEFYSKNKFEKLGHLVGFIIRIILTKSP
jgi:hypothetical protein